MRRPESMYEQTIRRVREEFGAPAARGLVPQPVDGFAPITALCLDDAPRDAFPQDVEVQITREQE